jgi:hypothetical protein
MATFATAPVLDVETFRRDIDAAADQNLLTVRECRLQVQRH